jgi:hypothetical protein
MAVARIEMDQTIVAVFVRANTRVALFLLIMALRDDWLCAQEPDFTSCF